MYAAMLPPQLFPGESRLRTRWVLIVAPALILIFWLQMLHAIAGESLPWDEGDHIFAGYESWKTHDFGLNPEHPPMVKLIGTLPLLPLDLKVPTIGHRFFKAEAYLGGRELLFRNGPADGGHYGANTLIFRARLFASIFSLIAAVLVFLGTTEMFSLTAGLIALTLFCFEPNLLAHGAYVTTDMAASCTFFATIYAFWRWVKVPSTGRLLTAGLVAGIALAAKHSTILLAPMLLLIAAGALFEQRRRKPDGTSATPRITVAHMLGACVAITILAAAVLWAFYFFRYSARPPGLALSPTLAEYVRPLAPHEAKGILLFAHLHLLPESWLYGLAALISAQPTEKSRERWTLVVITLLIFHVASTLHASPNYVTYSNEAWGGPAKTYLYLSDSNADWAQQLLAVSDFLHKNNINDCYFAYFATPVILPPDYGIACKLLPTFDSYGNNTYFDTPSVISGTVLISAGDLNGFEFGSRVLNPYESFRTLQPSAIIQNGVLVYDGTYSISLASALPYIDRSSDALKAHNIPEAVAQAQHAEQIAPGDVQPEFALGDVLAAAGNTGEARAAYTRASNKIETMEPEARQIWRKKLAEKLAALPAH